MSLATMTNNPSKMTVCVVDVGHCVELARRLAQDFAKVYYHTPWVETGPHLERVTIGDGLPDIERINYFWNPKFLSKVDLFVFPWTFFWDYQAKLRSEGKLVWGAGKGEWLEVYRSYFKDRVKEAGLPSWNYEVITGLSRLESYLREHEDVYVKVNSTVRGDCESWHSENYTLSEAKLLQMRCQWGPMAEHVEFVVEDAVNDAIEDGCDGYCVDGQWPDRIFESLEIKDCGMVCHLKPFSKLSEPVRTINECMSRCLAKDQFRGFWGSETRITEDGTTHFNDATCRQSSPMGELYQEMLTNLSDIVLSGAAGKLVHPESEWKYGVQAMVTSAFAMKSWPIYQVSKEIRRWIKFHYLIGSHGRLTSPPTVLADGNSKQIVGAVLGVGNTLKDAVEHLMENVEGLKGFDVCVNTHSIAKAISEIEEGEGRGVKFTSDPLPDVQEIVD